MIITTKVNTVYDNDPWLDPTEAIKYYIDGELCHIDVMGRYKGLSRIYDKPIYIITFTDGSTFGPFKSPIFSVSYSEKKL